MSANSEMLPLLLAVKQGLVSKEEVATCVARKEELAKEDTEVRADDLAVANGFLEPDQLKYLRDSAEALQSRQKGTTLQEASKIHIYDFERPIGKGAMASVFRARLKATGELRAVKILHPEHASNRLFVERFIREGKLLRAFHHPNISKGFEYGRLKTEGLYFMGMELLEGFSLQELIEQTGPFNEQKALYCVTESAKALSYIQSKGVVHRDIKPENIIWCRNGRIALLDLGFAKPISKSGENEYEDETCGTVQYISPEQARGRADVDVRADIYSLGATLYHLVTGSPPFSGQDSMEIMSKQVLENLDSNALKNNRVSGHLHYFIEKMMAKDRNMRYQSAQEIVEDIATVLHGAAELHYDPRQTGMFEAVNFADSTAYGRRSGTWLSGPQQQATGPQVATESAMDHSAYGSGVIPPPAPSGEDSKSSGQRKSVRMPQKRPRRSP